MSCSWLCICSGGEYEWLMVDVIPHIELQQVFVGQGTLYSTFTTWIAQKYCGWAASLENGVMKNAVVHAVLPERDRKLITSAIVPGEPSTSQWRVSITRSMDEM